MSYIFLQASSGGGFFSDPINLVLISASMFVLYFFMLRPNQKRAKEAKELIDNLKKGDKIITNSGIHGKVRNVNETTVEVDVATNTTLTIEKSAISIELSAPLNKVVEEK